MTSAKPSHNDMVCLYIAATEARDAKIALGKTTEFDGGHVGEAMSAFDRAFEGGNSHDQPEGMMKFELEPEVAKILPAAIGQHAVERKEKDQMGAYRKYQALSMKIGRQLINQGVAPW